MVRTEPESCLNYELLVDSSQLSSGSGPGEKSMQEILVSATCQRINKGWLPAGQSPKALPDSMQFFVAEDKIKPGSISVKA